MTSPLCQGARLQGESYNHSTECEQTQLLPSPSPSDSLGEQIHPHSPSAVKLESGFTPTPTPRNCQPRQPLEPSSRKRSVRAASSEGRTRKRPRTDRGTGRAVTETAIATVPQSLTKSGVGEGYESLKEVAKTIVPSDDRCLVSTSTGCGGGGGGSSSSASADCSNPIAHWANTGQWPDNFATMDLGSDSSKKRTQTPSYTQQSKNGEVPKADTGAFEQLLAEHGIVMNEVAGSTHVAAESRKLCEEMLHAQYEDPPYTLFPLSQFLLVWDRLRTRNEFRVCRDLTPLLVPSPELLFFSGQEQLEHLAEEVSVDWTKSQPLAGPRPRPDFAVGIAPSAFTDEEIAKLKNHSSSERATLFTDNVYFPFLLCEAKSPDQAIFRADRQCIRSSSMAVNAIIQLYQVLGEQKAIGLSGQILVFSISHNNESVKIYGHYAVVEDAAKLTFYRCRVKTLTLGPGDDAGNWKIAYSFVRALYDRFYPDHLKRIQDALEQMDDPRTRSIPAGVNIDDTSSQAPEFALPGMPASLTPSGQANQQAKRLRESMGLLEERFREQLADQKAQNERLMEQNRQQEERFREQVADQKAQNERLMEQNRQQLADQKAQTERLMEQNRQQMEMLQQLLKK